MKIKIPALLLSLIAARAFAAAPVEIHAVTEMPSAPTALVPAVMTAPALTPALASPISAASIALAPAAVAPAAAAASVAAPAAPAPLPASLVPSALSALPAAAAGDRKGPPAGGESSAQAAGAPFDGSAVPTDAELAALYHAARPGNQTVATLERQGGFAAAAGGIVKEYTFVNEHLLQGLRASPAMFHPEGRQLIKAVEELTSVSDAQDPAARRFLQALGRREAAQYQQQQRMETLMRAFLNRRGGGEERRHLPRNDLGSGDYWDMAAGMNAGGFILRELEPGTRYSFFDMSPFVVSYLNAIAARKGADAAAIEADILKLQRPERPLAVLRTKNAVAYVPGFEKKLSEMADWVAPGGRLVIQNDPMPGQRELIVKKHGPLAQRLIQEGWDFTFEFTSARGARHELDTLIFTRPKGAPVSLSPQQTREKWDRYVAAVKYVDASSGY
jgi:SAM-dependent methyltransferase